MSTREWLEGLAAQGLTRTAAARVAGLNAHDFKALCDQHPDVAWLSKGERMANMSRAKAKPLPTSAQLEEMKAAGMTSTQARRSWGVGWKRWKQHLETLAP